jgi:hypothetical protein
VELSCSSSREERVRVSKLDRKTAHTQVAQYEERLRVWEDAVNSSEQHIKIGKSLQARGLALLGSIQATGDSRIDLTRVDSGDLARLVQNATIAIEKGTQIERNAREELFNLHHHKPRKSG